MIAYPFSLSDRLISNVLDNLGVGVSLIDHNGNILYSNNIILQFLKCSRNEYAKRYSNVDQILTDGTLDRSFSAEVVKTKRPASGCQKIWDKEGELLTLYTNYVPIFDAEGDVSYAVGVLQPVEQLKRAYFQAVNFLEICSNNIYLPSKAPQSVNLIYQSAEMRRIVEYIGNISITDATILIQGESGTGKDVIANLIHDTSNRRNQKMIRLNCASVPANLFESELFGYERGAFTGAATGGKIGLIEEADGGTLFLDEINSLPLELQSKLLRTLEEKVIQKVGSNKQKRVNFRLIAATNADLMECVRNHTFRMDLFFRLNVVSIEVPPLRVRKDDIEPLTRHFLKQFCLKYNRQKIFSPAVFERLCQYNWPGNVRELRNFVERMVLMTDASTVEIKNFPDNFISEDQGTEEISHDHTPDTYIHYLKPGLTLSENMDFYEKRILLEALKRHGSPGRAAAALGINQSTMSRKIAKYGLGRW